MIGCDLAHLSGAYKAKVVQTRYGHCCCGAVSARDRTPQRGRRWRLPRDGSGSFQEFDANIVWPTHKGDLDTGADGAWLHREVGAALFQLSVCGIEVIDPEPEMIQAKMRIMRRLSDVGICRHTCQKHR